MRFRCILLAIISILLFSKCSTHTDIHEILSGNATGDAQEETDETVTLSNRFNETTRFSFSKVGDRPLFKISPYYDVEAKTLTVLTEYHDIVELSSNGETLNKTKIPETGIGSIVSGVISDNSVLWCGVDYLTDDIYLERCLRSGTEYSFVCISDICEDALSDKMFTAENNGILLYASSTKLLAFNEELMLLYSLSIPDDIVGVGFLSDGSPSCVTHRGAEYTVWKVNTENHLINEYERISDAVYQFFYAEGADFYYLLRDGIYGMTDHQKFGVMSTVNSGFLEEQMILTMAGPDYLIAWDYLSSDDVYVLWERAEDLSFSSVRQLNVVFTGIHSQSIDRALSAYNRSHPEFSLNITDLTGEEYTYFSSNTEEFIFELANGFSDADIIITTQENSLVDAVLSKHLYMDLSPYLARDEIINQENTFSIVLSTFKTEEDEIWGLTPSFSIDTVTGRRDILGSYADAGVWTLDSFLSFASSLASGYDTAIGKNLTQMNAETILGSSGFNRWIDYEAGTCTFTDESFGRYLDFVTSLPRDLNALKTRYPFVEELFQFNTQSLSDAWRSGKVALDIGNINGVYDMILQEIRFGTWGTDNLIRIGYPIVSAGADSIASLTSIDVCIITRSCKDPDAAWDLIRSVFETDPILEANRVLENPFPALKSEFEKIREAYGKYFIIYGLTADGIPSTAIIDRGSDTGEDIANRVDGLLLDVTPEFLDRVYSLLDGARAIPVVDNTPAAIQAIVQEEISSLTGGGQSRETCMRNIQSRVSIWLAEHQ